MNKVIARQLRQIDWDFPFHRNGFLTGLHWYPGTFPSPLPASLIEALSQHNDTVLDPFCGIGTAPSEAIRLGRACVGVEMNPIGYLVSYVAIGLSLLLKKDPEYLRYIEHNVRTHLSLEKHGQTLFTNFGISAVTSGEIDQWLESKLSPPPQAVLSEIRKPRWDLLAPWFDPDTIAKIQVIVHAINEIDSVFVRLCAYTMISDRLRALSSQNKSWGHIADNVLPKKSEIRSKDPAKACLMWLRQLEQRTGQIACQGPMPRRKSYLVRHDWSSGKNPVELGRIPSIEVLVTSPPYSNAIDYSKAQRLSLFLMGFSEEDISRLVKTEIGARAKRFRPDSTDQWEHALGDALVTLIDSIKSLQHIVLVLPCRDLTRDPTVNTLLKRLETSGHTKEMIIERSINQLRTRQSWTSISREIIAIFARK